MRLSTSCSPTASTTPRRPSGGNVYDRRVCDGLAARGWSVREHVVAGQLAGARASRPVARCAPPSPRCPTASVVLVDGLDRLRRPGRARARVAAGPRSSCCCTCRSARSATIPSWPTTSARCSRPRPPSSRRAAWTRDRVLDRYRLDPDRRARRRARNRRGRAVVAAQPAGTRLICVAAADAEQGSRRPARRPRDARRPALDPHARRQPRPTDPAYVEQLRGAGPRTSGSPRGSTAPGRSSVAPSMPRGRTRTPSSSPPVARRTAWSSPSPWRAGCR